MLTRRCCLAGCGLLLFGIAGAAAAGSRHNPIYGCSLSSSEADNILGNEQDARRPTGDVPMILTSGDKDFDYALAQTLNRISDCLNVTPAFAYYDDSDAPAAFATDRKRVAGTDGTVLFGRRYLKELLARPEAPDAAVVAVCAHEFGHILQFKLKLDKLLLDGQTTVKRLELHADFLAGYFAGVRKWEKPSFNAAVVAMTQFKFGDPLVNDKDHHGTPEERGQAIVKGYQIGHDDRKPLLDAIPIGMKYVMDKF